VSGYSPHTPADIEEMLDAIGVKSIDDLFRQVPARLRELAAEGRTPGMTEPELRAHLEGLSSRSTGATATAFLGAGAYPHWVPTVVDQILLRSEFATAYTPYQPEVSQGTLQAIFEFQTFSAMLLGLDVANASMYDGASAAAEAVLMARRLLPGRRTVLVARSLHPHYRETLRTYTRGLDAIDIVELPFAADGRVDGAALGAGLAKDALCVVLGYPNVFGVIEDVAGVAAHARAAGALTITATSEPLALALLRSPGGCGADIAVAEGQGLGLPVAYGGPGVGLLATREVHLRSMPGRIVGETVDGVGRRGYVLTLATREQHIRRERATSNICTNQGLCALAVTVYLSLLGKNGLRRLAEVNRRNAWAAAARLEAGGVGRALTGPFFNEFVVRVPDAAARADAAAADGLVPGLPLERWYPELPDTLLVCVTEVHGEPEIARLVDTLAEPRRQPRSVRR